MGCIWLTDIKLEWEGRLLVPPLPVKAGTRYAIWHCCCKHPTLPKEKKEVERQKWDKFRETFREEWSKKFGQWPTEGKTSWPGHHIWDLWHGGNPVDPNNIIPVAPAVHNEFGRQYPACYAGSAPWNTVGPNLPYTDN
jgi:hypothetical protein